MKKGKNILKEFKRRFCILKDDFMYYYESEEDFTPLGLINLLLCTVKTTEQKGCFFEIILPHRSFLFQAETSQEMDEWINAIRNTNARLYNELPEPAEKSKENKETDITTAEVAVTPSVEAKEPEVPVETEKDPRELLKEFLEQPDTGNNICADCSTPDPRWASINLGIMVCIECSGIHRSLGVQISQVRSLDLDRWTLETVQFMQTMGNKRANQIWEWQIPTSDKKPSPTDPRAVKEEWINRKYVQKLFADPAIVPKEETPFPMPEKKGTSISIVKEGFLTKQGNTVKSWKRRWFVLKTTQSTASLYYFRNRGDPLAAGFIDMVSSAVRKTNIATRPNSFEIITPSRIYSCVADNSQEMNTWINKLKEVIEKYKKDMRNSEKVDAKISKAPFSFGDAVLR